MIDITSENIHLIDDFKSLKDNPLKHAGKIIVESEKVVMKLLNSDLTIDKFLATEEFITRHSSLINSKVDPSKILTADKNIMEKIIGHNLHHGVMALAERPSYVELHQLGNNILILNGLTSPENVGTIVRNCIAFGIESIIVDHKTCCPYARRAIRVSIGNIFRAKIHHTENLSHTLEQLAENGYDLLLTANLPNSTNIEDYSFSKKSALVIGSEGNGIDKPLLEKFPNIVRIPIDDQVAALNAASSSAIFLYKLASYTTT